MTIWKRANGAAETIIINVDGKDVQACDGETVATVLLRMGHRAFGASPVTGKARAPACMMGVCFGCLCTIDGHNGSQACLELVRDGTVVETELEPPS